MALSQGRLPQVVCVWRACLGAAGAALETGPQEFPSLPRQDAAGLSSAPAVVMGAGRSPIPGAVVEQLGWEGPKDSADNDLANLGQGRGPVTLHPGPCQSSIAGQQSSGATDTNTGPN